MSKQDSSESQGARVPPSTANSSRDSSSILSHQPPPPPPFFYQAPIPYPPPQPWATGFAPPNPFQQFQQFYTQNWAPYSMGPGYPFAGIGDFGQSPYGFGQPQVAQPVTRQRLELKQHQYGTLHFVRSHKAKSWRVDKPYRSVTNMGSNNNAVNQVLPLPQTAQGAEDKGTTKKKKHKDPKIMLPAPQPTQDYFEQAMEEPFVIDPPDRVLVVLDLNGTLIHRPNRNRPKHLIARPFLKPFLQYLFENFSVMVWSSAKPENVEGIVKQVLDEELQSKLVAAWARNTFGLDANHYNLNVQVYKDLTKIWNNDEVQRHKPGYTFGKRFGPDSTILIDDSVLKANAQPHNLLEIPEFAATGDQMKSDILREVAGYLQIIRMQNNVSSFMRKHPFKADGTWMYDWPDDMAGSGEIGSQTSPAHASPQEASQQNPPQQKASKRSQKKAAKKLAQKMVIQLEGAAEVGMAATPGALRQNSPKKQVYMEKAAEKEAIQKAAP